MLLLLAEIVATIHTLLYCGVLPIVAWVENLVWKRIRLWTFCIILLIVTLPSQLLFSWDCPLRIFEFCLRGLGGEIFDPFRFRTMGKLLGEGMTSLQIYNLLLWKTGVYLLVVGAGIAIASLAIDAWWQRGRNRIR